MTVLAAVPDAPLTQPHVVGIETLPGRFPRRTTSGRTSAPHPHRPNRVTDST